MSSLSHLFGFTWIPKFKFVSILVDTPKSRISGIRNRFVFLNLLVLSLIFTELHNLRRYANDRITMTIPISTAFNDDADR